jgi:glycosyltransferase involved in cell wall biosynthesis
MPNSAGTVAPNPDRRERRFELSIVIPTRNSNRSLEEALCSIADQSSSPVEVLVVDSSNNGETIGPAQASAVKVIHAVVNRAEARGIGIRQALGSHVLLMDSDQVLDRNAIQNLEILASVNPESAQVLRELTPCRNAWERLLALQDISEFERGLGLPRLYPRNLVLRFDWDTFRGKTHVHGEDRLLRDWFTEQGGRVILNPSAEIIHRGDPALVPYLQKQFRNAQSGMGWGMSGPYLSSLLKELPRLARPGSSRGSMRSGYFAPLYYWFLFLRAAFQFAGMIAALLKSEVNWS